MMISSGAYRKERNVFNGLFTFCSRDSLLVLMIVARFLTNHHVRAHFAEIVSAGTTSGNIPPLFSVIYLVGFLD